MPQKMDISEASRFHLKSESWVHYPPLMNMFTEADLRADSDDDQEPETVSKRERARENLKISSTTFLLRIF